MKSKVSATSQEIVLESNELIFQEFYHISSLVDPLEADDFNQIYFTENDAIKLMLQMSQCLKMMKMTNEMTNRMTNRMTILYTKQRLLQSRNALQP